MQYGAMNSPLKPILTQIDELAALGFDYLELTLDAPEAHYLKVHEQQSSIDRLLRRHDLGLVCHMPTFVYTADLTASLRRTSLNEVLHSLETAAQLGAQKIVLHPSILSGLGPLVKETAVAYALESLDTLLQKARELAQCICLENMFPRLGYMVEPAEFAPLFETYPELKLTLDIGHAFIGARTPARILDFIHQFPDRLHHIHISDNRGKRDDHLPVGQGNIPYGEVMCALLTQGYNGTMTLEIFSEKREDLATSRKRIAELLQAGMEGKKSKQP